MEKALKKLFEDDTTLILEEESMEKLIGKIKNCLVMLDVWCKFNRLYINWNKTFIMFITNKRLKIPEFIQIDDRKIEVVTKFKLLGVILDNKLRFDSFVSQQCLSISIYQLIVFSTFHFKLNCYFSKRLFYPALITVFR